MELKDLVGEHELTGVDRYNADVKTWYGSGFESCEHLSFCLDGVTYTAIEDPSDGYRSCMRDLEVTDIELKNTFSPVRVIARIGESDYEYESDILELISVANGGVILRVGTDNTDDYYPWFVCEFDPTVLGQLEPAAEPRGEEA